jgi:hypothetical protein
MAGYNWGGGQGPWGGSYWGGGGAGNFQWPSPGQPAGGGLPTTTGGEFDFGQLDPQSFDYDKWLGSFYQDIAGTLPTGVGFDITGGQAGPRSTPEGLGYNWNAVNQRWEREEAGTTYSRSQQEMEELLQRENRGMPGTAMGEALGLYEADINRLLEAERGNFMRDLQLKMAGIERSFAGAADVRAQAESSADVLRNRAQELGGLAEETITSITDWVDTQMGEVERLGDMAIQHALSAETEFAAQLANYKDATAQKMSATAIGIQRAAAPVMSAITTGMHPDGTPMTKQEQQASYLALNYQTSVQVQHAMAPLAFEREQTLLQGSQFAAQLSQQTAAVQQQQAGIQAEAGAQFGGLLLGAEQQAAAYRSLAEQLTLQAENALASAQLNAAQLETAGLFQAAQLQRNFNPVSFLSGFLGLLSVPPEVWRRNFPMNLEFNYD